MEVTGATLRTLGTGFKTNYQNGFDEVDPSWNKIAEEIPSTTASNEYGWLGEWPSLREWIGDRLIKALTGHSYTIKNKEFESTVGVKATDIEDDNLGIYAGRFKAMGRAAARWPDELVWPALAAGFSSECYDGQFFFDTDHPVGDPAEGNVKTVSNMQAGGGDPWFLLDTSQALMPLILQMRKRPVFTQQVDANTSERVFMKGQHLYGVDGRANVGYGFWQMAFASKAELNEDNFKAAYAAMTSLENDQGGKLAIKPTLLVVGSSNQWKADELLKKARKANGEDNILQGKVDGFVSPYLA
ncbi:Mu-like prophage major head subunit gpT family protein [Roseibium litorale]|uniref:Mu-like prophage major head subunit gpT family protein n=1 Tax=Roseibium litorale TaxID=2803841 RepID=A0ABR9CKG5_9HYPH|nr:Mu-like prophage major head subunit gpT family protein [Roseibium litorale]MBD8890905.1 Mu-like prophage major head subunit gpT family protein [Roseibium litorale]